MTAAPDIEMLELIVREDLAALRAMLTVGATGEPFRSIVTAVILDAICTASVTWEKLGRDLLPSDADRDLISTAAALTFSRAELGELSRLAGTAKHQGDFR